MEFILTSKGKSCLLYKGHSYRKFRENKQGEVTWVCMKEKSAKCKGKIVTKNDSEIRSTDHDCVPDEAAMEVKKSVFQAKKRAREDSDTPIPKVFKQEIAPLQNKGYEFVTELPQFSNLKSVLYAIRNESQGVQKEPKQPEEIVLDEETLKMADGSSFLLADEGEKNRILMFAGSKGKYALRKNKCFFYGWNVQEFK